MAKKSAKTKQTLLNRPWTHRQLEAKTFGDNDINRIFRLGHVLDNLISRTTKTPAKKTARTFDFDSKQMSRKKKERLISKTVRKMLSWHIRALEIG
ncbi:4504_t:CDS:2 [Gigaspora margarita]|uniref:4504_t:CDS:1 n=1 Tax=Gigaspora margarita TaxID=4874 RepID=A0ABN7UE12_GIGMA|nr:4504_t:CDS:2 [Gigaspora margarita]